MITHAEIDLLERKWKSGQMTDLKRKIILACRAYKKALEKIIEVGTSEIDREPAYNLQASFAKESLEGRFGECKHSVASHKYRDNPRWYLAKTVKDYATFICGGCGISVEPTKWEATK